MAPPPPPLPPRPSVGRSSFAIAMKDYTFIRPGIAITISAATLIVALLFGFDLIGSLQRAARTVTRGASASQQLHGLSAAYEVGHQMATSSNPAYRRPQAGRQLVDRADGLALHPLQARGDD